MMNKLVVVFMIMLALQSSSKVVMPEGNYFARMHSFIQKTMNTLFLMMNLNRNFTINDKNRLLLSMHANLKTMAERNYEVYGDIKKLCVIDTKRKPKGGILNLDRLTDVLIEEKVTTNINGPFKNGTQFRKSLAETLKIASIELPDNSEEALIFLREYMHNVEGMELIGFETPYEKLKKLYQSNQVQVISRKKLKAWRANKEKNSNELSSINGRRIFEGKHVKIKHYPFMASIHVINVFVCGGSILSTVMVITAATCLQIVFNSPKFLRENPNSVMVRVGSDYAERFGESYFVKVIFFHPNFNPETLENNLVILQIDKKMLLRKKNRKIRRIEYSGKDAKMPDAKKIQLLGWGNKEPDKSSFDPLASTFLNIYSLDQCIEVYTSNFVKTLNFCAGYTTKGSGACQRDIGGPAIVNDVLVGVVSFGPPVCGTPDAPTVFTNIAHYITWIDDIVKGPDGERPVDIKRKNKSHKELNVNESVSIAPSTTAITHTTSDIVRQADMRSRLQTLQKFIKSPDSPFKPRSQYPKAIEVISDLINQILTGEGQSMSMGNIMYDSDSDDYSDGLGTIITDNGPVPVTDLAYNNLRNGPETEENPFITILRDIFPPARTTTSEHNHNLQTFDPKIRGGETMTSSALNVHVKNKDPIAAAIEVLKKSLGISIAEFNTAKPIPDPAKSGPEIPEYIKSKITFDKTESVPEITTEPKTSSEQVNARDGNENYSDNYESEESMSIEIPTGVPYVASTFSSFSLGDPFENYRQKKTTRSDFVRENGVLPQESLWIQENIRQNKANQLQENMGQQNSIRSELNRIQSGQSPEFVLAQWPMQQKRSKRPEKIMRPKFWQPIREPHLIQPPKQFTSVWSSAIYTRSPGDLRKLQNLGQAEHLMKPKETRRPENSRRPERMERRQENLGRPKDMRSPENIKKPFDIGRQENLLRPEGLGRPYNLGRSNDKARTENVQRPDDIGRPENLKKPEGMGRQKNFYRRDVMRRPENSRRPEAIGRPEDLEKQKKLADKKQNKSLRRESPNASFEIPNNLIEILNKNFVKVNKSEDLEMVILLLKGSEPTAQSKVPTTVSEAARIREEKTNTYDNTVASYESVETGKEQADSTETFYRRNLLEYIIVD